MKKGFQHRCILSLAALLLALLMIFPFLWMLSSSFKDSYTMFSWPIRWIPRPLYLGGYKKVWMSDIPFPLFYLNSIKVSLLSLVGTLISCTLSGYAYAKIRFAGRDLIFIMKLATIMIPFQVTMLPTFIIFRALGLYNTHAALWLPFFFGQPIGVFLMRQYFSQVPEELCEAARMDGAGHLKILHLVVAPLSAAGISVLLFLYFVASWNNYSGPLLYIYEAAKYTLPLTARYFTDEFDTNYSALMAAGVSTMLPLIIVFLVMQKRIMDSYMGSGFK